MNSFVEPLTTAARNHAEARIDYYTDLSQSVLRSLRQLSDVHAQFSRESLDDATTALRYALLTSPEERSAENAPLQPGEILQKLQAYHQRLTQVAAEFQSDINQIAQEHVPQTARTASELADAGRQAANKHLADEASRFAAIAQQNQALQQPQSMQSAGEGNKS
ncbi:hypothetical protein GTP45_14335 [Pseudoduganella sp. FT55W]|uniref:Phasin domain-containing protein n=1 Tax=Duganella rivi TaxID=2666083 RepID=A0A7X4GRQ9_9BURK|nr:phasin family protein [Duganella rivi]MYM67999.1 hypothetical protein [Duganella rivi]